MNLIELKDVSFKYTSTLFLDLNLQITNKTFLCIAGCNNSGKTTLLKILSGELMCDNIYYLGEKVNDPNLLKEKVCYINKDTIFYSKTIIDELSLYTSNEYEIKKLLNYFNLINYINSSPNTLSSENKLILKIIISLLKKTEVILLDNVFSFFSNDFKKNFINLLFKYTSKKEIAVIFTTNDLNESIYFDELLIINDNKLGYAMEKSNLTTPFSIELSEKLMLYNLIEEEEYNIEKLVDKLC